MSPAIRALQEPITLAGHTIREVDLGDGDYAWRIRDLPDGYHLDVLTEYLYNLRLVETTPGGMLWRRGWCYEGKGLATLMTVFVAALDWEYSPDTTPQGWKKDLAAQEYRTQSAWPDTWMADAIQRLRDRASTTGEGPA